MSATQIKGKQVYPTTIQRSDMDVGTPGQAVVTKIVQGNNITISSTGADSGTGDVTINAPAPGLTQVSSDASLSGLGTPASPLALAAQSDASLSGLGSAASPLKVVGVNGVTNGSNAAAGQVGEMITSAKASSAAGAMGANVAVNILSISLTAGDWDVQGSVGIYITSLAANTAAQLSAAIGNSATIADDGYQGYGEGVNPSAAAATPYNTIPMPPRRFSLTATTTIYLVGRTSIAGSGFGYIQARRVR
jgi:hypothetical protein